MCDSVVDRRRFWKAIEIWTKNPHVVNRRLSGVVDLHYLKTDAVDISTPDPDALSSDRIERVLCGLGLKSERVIVLDESPFETKLSEDESAVTFVIVQKLLARSCWINPNVNTFRVISMRIDRNQGEDSARFVSVSLGEIDRSISPAHPYSLELVKGDVRLRLLAAQVEDSSAKWLKEKLLPRILKWAASDCETTGNNILSGGSIAQVSLEEYNELYSELKTKYAHDIVKIWPETTDPSKFVFEDVAIATYLLLIWKDERQKLKTDKMQTFVDLGCGNGLLVYILCSEGHPGKGIDVRQRGIWKMYPGFINLEIGSITPSEECLYKDVDWIIGNHSDELTPWIPVIAARSSYKCRFFLLPCCAYDFDGSKYQRHNSSISQYNEYLEYIKSICEKCGINTVIDRLRIPSTKRICLLGTSRLYLEENYEYNLEELRRYVEERCRKGNLLSLTNDIPNVSQWASNFKPREAIEKVRNCTQIEKCIVNSIVSKVALHLLLTENLVNNWNLGGCLPINEVVELIPEKELKYLKSECGGLQTLLKNNHNVFEVISGKVKLRYPRTKSDVLKKIKSDKIKRKKYDETFTLSKRPCWFFENHPNGCPLNENDCSYLHI